MNIEWGKKRMILSLRGLVRVKVISIISCLKMEEHILKKYIYMSIAVHSFEVCWSCVLVYSLNVFIFLLYG